MRCTEVSMGAIRVRKVCIIPKLLLTTMARWKNIQHEQVKSKNMLSIMDEGGFN